MEYFDPIGHYYNFAFCGSELSLFRWNLSYAIFKDKKDRHVADKVLEQEAKQIKNDPNTDISEKASAFVVETVMKGKQKLGLGKTK